MVRRIPVKAARSLGSTFVMAASWLERRRDRHVRRTPSAPAIAVAASIELMTPRCNDGKADRHDGQAQGGALGRERRHRDGAAASKLVERWHRPAWSAGGTKPLQALSAAEEVMHGDLRDPAVVDRLLEGVDVLIHLAGTSVERPLPEIIENNLVALHEVYEGARRHGVKRIVFASSNHAFGMHSVDGQAHDRRAVPPRRLLRPEQGLGRGHDAGCTGTSTGSRASRSGSAAPWSGRPSSATSAPGSATRT